MKQRLKLSIGITTLLGACFVLAACPNAVQDASNAVNKYANTLSAFQDAEIKLHDAGKISDAKHVSILQAEIVAAKAGHDLDAAIAVASKGNDPAQYVDVATKSFDDMIAITNTDPTGNQELALVANTASAALKNAISLIQALRANPPKANGPASVPMWALWLLPFMFAAGAVGGVQLTQAVALLQIVMQLEPVAFDLIVKLAASMKGKTADEILAMNESLFSKVEQTAQDELAKVSPKPTS